jgi:hypothetical protein
LKNACVGMGAHATACVRRNQHKHCSYCTQSPALPGHPRLPSWALLQQRTEQCLGPQRSSLLSQTGPFRWCLSPESSKTAAMKTQEAHYRNTILGASVSPESATCLDPRLTAALVHVRSSRHVSNAATHGRLPHRVRGVTEHIVDNDHRTGARQHARQRGLTNRPPVVRHRIVAQCRQVLRSTQGGSAAEITGYPRKAAPLSSLRRRNSDARTVTNGSSKTKALM